MADLKLTIELHSYPNMIRVILLIFFLSGVSAFARDLSSPPISKLPSLRGAAIDFGLEQLPSALWPTFVVLEDSEGLSAKTGARGILIRVVGDELLVDFGRDGLMTIDPRRTNFLEAIKQAISDHEEKDFPNLALQIGNKLMRFDRGENSGAIRFKHVEEKVLYILLYVDQYSPDLAQELLDFGAAYADLEDRFPELIVVIMPNDRTFYDFAATTGYGVPMITPHVRRGYINSLAHRVSDYPAFVACDANGKVITKSKEGLSWKHLSQELETLLSPIGIDWSAPYIRQRSSNTRAASWLR